MNIHASCVSLNDKGILLLGKSGIGKSDLTLRLIEQLGAVLVADDRVDLIKKNNNIYASCPKNITGLLEVRGLGIISKPYLSETCINLVVELVSDFNLIERLPERQYYEFEQQQVQKIKIYPFEQSAVYKIKAACDEIG